MSVQRGTGFGPGFSRDVEAILSVVAAGEQTGYQYMHPVEVRRALRIAGLPLEEALPAAPQVMFDFEAEAEWDPDELGDEPVGLDTDDEETPDA